LQARFSLCSCGGEAGAVEGNLTDYYPLHRRGGNYLWLVAPPTHHSGSWLQFIAPIQTTLNGPSNAVGGLENSARSVVDLNTEVLFLRGEVARLEQEAVRNAELERENQQLREALNLKSAYPDWEYLEASVVATDPANLVRALTINKGSKDGVKEGMTVVTPAGLVGRVTKVTPVAAKVLLLTDSSSSVTSMIQNSRAVGVVNGERAEYLQMSYIPQAETVRSGDKAVTSGLGGIYPPGILIGNVVSVSKKDTDMFQEARIDPAVKTDNLEKVLIITNHIPVKLDLN
jgi:rod shape-determining protein MreC